MQLTLHTDLSLRLLIVLARNDGQPMSLTSFAAEQKVSYNHMTKVAQELVGAGYLESLRGRSGGVKLARSPAEITIGEIVRTMEPNMQMADCTNCAIRNDCGLTGMLGDATQAFMARLDARTLAEAARTSLGSST